MLSCLLLVQIMSMMGLLLCCGTGWSMELSEAVFDRNAARLAWQNAGASAVAEEGAAANRNVATNANANDIEAVMNPVHRVAGADAAHLQEVNANQLLERRQVMPLLRNGHDLRPGFRDIREVAIGTIILLLPITLLVSFPSVFTESESLDSATP